MSGTEPAKPKHSGLIPYQPGQSGNPAGRPKGSRNKLGEAFLEDLHADWAKHGKEALELCRATEPAQYCRIVASLLPKQVEHTAPNIMDELSDDDVAVGLAAIRAAREAGKAGAKVPRGKQNTNGSKEPDRVH